MAYRTRTYIAGDWSGDSDLINQLYKWNDSNYWGLHFVDAHGLTQARDSSLNCSIKRSLRERLDRSKVFVLVVGLSTNEVRAGSCAYCSEYYAELHRCWRNHSTDTRSYIHYECEYAANHIDKIVVLHNCSYVDRDLCPEPLRYRGVHIPSYEINDDYSTTWLYQDIKTAICG